MAQQEEGANRDGFFSFLDGALTTASNTAAAYWATRYAGRTEQVPTSNTGGTENSNETANAEPMIAGVPQSTLFLGFGGLLLFALIARG